MPQVPVPFVLLAMLLALIAPPTEAKKTAAPGCWSDGRKDVIVRVDECPPEPPPLEEMTLWLSWYDPALCYDDDGNVIENINCDANPEAMAGGTAVSADLYGNVAACPLPWKLGESVVYVPGIGSWLCLDRGGDIRPTYREIYHPQQGFVTLWVLPIDVLYSHDAPPPWWEYLPIEADSWQLLKN